MKFGKEFRVRIEEILPEWRDNYLCYKTLKRLLKHFPFTVDLENLFLTILNQELEKFNDFYMDKEEEFVIRFKDLKERIDIVKEKISQNGVFSSGSELHDEKTGILNDFFTIQGELVVLKNYCSLNFLGLIKILKKHDKRTGGTLRIPFFQLALQQPFFNAEPLTMLVRDCEANLEFLF